MRGSARIFGQKLGKLWQIGPTSSRPESGSYPRLLAKTVLDWVPTAKKNRHRIARYGRPCPVCGERKAGIRASARSEADQEALALVAASLRGKAPYTPPTDHALSLRVAYLVSPRAGLDRVLVELWDLGPEGPPSSPLLRRGRTRDLDNLVQGIADAFQGVLYANDRQIAELVVCRQLLTPTP